jgi:hypothetical protein
MTAGAVVSKGVRTQRALLIAVGGVIAIGLAMTAFAYLDQPVGQQTVLGGTVTNTWRERGGYVYCQVRLSDGIVINEQCDGLPVGTQVTVEKRHRQLSGRAVYSGPRSSR